MKNKCDICEKPIHEIGRLRRAYIDRKKFIMICTKCRNDGSYLKMFILNKQRQNRWQERMKEI
jgi:hypothetical protein